MPRPSEGAWQSDKMAASIDDVVSGNDLDTILSLLDDDFFKEDQEIVKAMVSSVNEVSLCVYFMYKRHATHPILREFWLGPTPFGLSMNF